MNSDWIEWLPFGAVVYGLMFGIFIVPLLITGWLCLRAGKSLFEKVFGGLTFLTPAAGAAFYTTVDYFERNNKLSLWWILIVLIHVLPLAASSYIIFKNRRTLLKLP